MLTSASWSGALLVYFSYTFHLLLYLVPGCAAATLFERRRRLTPLAFTVLLVTTAALLGYISFWLFLGNKSAGRMFSYVTYLTSLTLIGAARRRKDFWKSLWSTVRIPLSFTMLAGWLYLSLLCLYGDPSGHAAGLANRRFFAGDRPGDNLIPLIFADKVYSRQPLRPFCCGDWLSSDRPPLQTGVVVLLRPLRVSRNEALNYQSLSTALQCLWIFGVWSLLEACGAIAGYSSRVLALLVFSCFLFYNSVFVWPKLLAASLMLLSLSFLIRALRENRPVSVFDSCLAGTSLGLALMAHPGSVFSLPAFLLPLWFRRRLFPWRVLAIAAAIPALFLLSWSAYQHWIDPPGNRLAKMHLAGVMDIDNRTFPQALRDSYHRFSWSAIASHKWSNLRQIVGPFTVSGLEPSRIAQREYISNAVGLLNAGWLGLFAWLLRRGKPAVLKPFAWLIAAALFNLLVWALTLFGPTGTFTTESSYADIFLLAAPLAMFLVVALPGWVARLTLACQIVNLLIIWSWQPHQQMIPAFVTGALACITLLLWMSLLRSRPLEGPSQKVSTVVKQRI